jgi:hypothetical protein
VLDGARTGDELERKREDRRQLLLLDKSEMYKLLREEKEKRTTATGVGFLS